MADSITLKHILSNVVPSRYDMEEKILAFYKLVIDLERSKEPDIREYFEYPVNYKNEKLMLVDFPCNKQFRNLFETNRDSRATKWPNDLYVGLIMVTEGRSYRLLNMIISYEDIKSIDINNELLPVRISDFEVNLKEAERLELIPEKVESINSGIKANPTMQGILQLLRKEIAEDITIPNTLFLALSTKSMELAQIYSELNNRRLSDSLSSGHLLDAFLTYATLDNCIDNVESDQLIQITDLDDSQRIAVAKALNSKVSVITGPPGTGKTQVIENLLANALLRGKKVLVASKNNKAVDNVKDRFDAIDSTGYFVRFGSKQHVADSTLPEINRILTNIARSSDNIDEFTTLNSQYEKACSSIKDAKAKLAKRESLLNEIPALQDNVTDTRTSLGALAPEHARMLTSIDNEFSSILDLKDISQRNLSDYLSKIKVQKNNIEAKLSGFLGFWHRMFSKKSLAMELLNEVESFPYNLKGHLSSLSLLSDVSEFKNLEDFSGYCNEVMQFIEKPLAMNRKIEQENTRYNRQKASAERQLAELSQKLSMQRLELDRLNANRSSYLSCIESNKRWIENNSMKLLQAFIRHYLQSSQSAKKINDYKAYIPDNIPWKDLEYATFTRKTKDFLDVIRLCAVTSLSAKNAFPLCNDLFDMVVIDEASQCDIASAIPLVMRAKQIVIIGDPMQLRHITTVKQDEETEIKKYLGLDGKPFVKYSEQSLWDYCQSLISNSKSGMTEPHMLQGHYRCFPDIINYSNEVFYEGMLGHRLEVKTNVSKLKANPQGIVLIDVKGKQVNDNVNVNQEEVKKSLELAIDTANKYPDASIGIVTPFRHQAEKINASIPSQYANRIEANTVHKYQGDEKDVMIYSLVVTTNSPDKKIKWIDNTVPNLVNVAVTRAKSTLYVVCDVDYIKSHSSSTKPLGHLVRYKS